MAEKFPLASRYDNGFANGVDILGAPVSPGFAGNVFWVSATDGSDGNRGTRSRPFATLSKAIGTAESKRGDVVFLVPGHKETIADALNINKENLTIIGLGSGRAIPTILCDGGNASDGIDVTAANVTVQNIMVKSGTSDITAAFDVDAVGFTAKGIKFRENATHENFLRAFWLGAADNNCDEATIVGCDFFTATDSHTAFIQTVGDIDHLTVGGNKYMIGALAGAAGSFVKTTATGDDFVALDMGGNVMQVTTTATDSYPLIQTTLKTTNSGMIYDNRIGTSISNTNATSNFLTKATGFRWGENFQSGASGHGGSLHPTATN